VHAYPTASTGSDSGAARVANADSGSAVQTGAPTQAPPAIRASSGAAGGLSSGVCSAGNGGCSSTYSSSSTGRSTAAGAGAAATTGTAAAAITSTGAAATAAATVTGSGRAAGGASAVWDGPRCESPEEPAAAPGHGSSRSTHSSTTSSNSTSTRSSSSRSRRGPSKQPASTLAARTGSGAAAFPAAAGSAPGADAAAKHGAGNALCGLRVQAAGAALLAHFGTLCVYVGGGCVAGEPLGLPAVVRLLTYTNLRSLAWSLILLSLPSLCISLLLPNSEPQFPTPTCRPSQRRGCPM